MSKVEDVDPRSVKPTLERITEIRVVERGGSKASSFAISILTLCVLIGQLVIAFDLNEIATTQAEITMRQSSTEEASLEAELGRDSNALVSAALASLDQKTRTLSLEEREILDEHFSRHLVHGDWLSWDQVRDMPASTLETVQRLASDHDAGTIEYGLGFYLGGRKPGTVPPLLSVNWARQFRARFDYLTTVSPSKRRMFGEAKADLLFQIEAIGLDSSAFQHGGLNLRNTKFVDRALEFVDFDGIYFSDTVFSNVTFEEVRFLGCDLSGCTFCDCSFVACSFEESSLPATGFEQCEIDSLLSFDGAYIPNSAWLADQLVHGERGLDVTGAGPVDRLTSEPLYASGTSFSLSRTGRPKAPFYPPASYRHILRPPLASNSERWWEPYATTLNEDFADLQLRDFDLIRLKEAERVLDFVGLPNEVSITVRVENFGMAENLTWFLSQLANDPTLRSVDVIGVYPHDDGIMLLDMMRQKRPRCRIDFYVDPAEVTAELKERVSSLPDLRGRKVNVPSGEDNNYETPSAESSPKVN